MSWVSARMQQLQRESRRRRISAWTPPFQEAARVLLRSKALTLLLDPRRGGRLLELNDKRAERNLLGAGWTDHLWDLRACVREFERGRTRELSDLPLGPYSVRVKEAGGFVRAELSRQARLGKAALRVAKEVTLPARGRRALFAHRLTNDSNVPLEFLFASEFTLSLKDAHVNRVGDAPGVRRFAVLDPAAGLNVAWVFSRPARLWYFPLESGSGRRRVYHGVKLTGVWPVKLAPRQSWAVRWEWKVEEPGGWHLDRE